MEIARVHLKADFRESKVREWGINVLERARVSFAREAAPGELTMNVDTFVQLFQELSTKDAVRLFKQFSERASVRDMTRARSARGSALTIFTGMCLLCGASPLEKLRFLFDVFDLSKSASLWADECAIFLTCILRAFGTLADHAPALLKKNPQVLDAIVQRPFQEHAILYLSWPMFRDWAFQVMQDLVVDRDHTIDTPSNPMHRKTTKRRARSGVAIPDAEQDRESQTDQPRADEEETAFGARANNQMSPCECGVESGASEESEFPVRRGSSRLGGSNKMTRGPEIIGPEEDSTLEDVSASVDILSLEEDEQQDEEGARRVEERTYAKAAPESSPRGEGDCEDLQHGQDDMDEEGDADDFLDANQAMDQILSCLPEIDAGDLSSLPWLLNATRMLAEHDECATLGNIVPQILPLVCNVAACEDPDLAMQAFQVLGAIIDGAPEKVCESSDTVNERALLEMCLVRSVDADPLIGAAASTCLYRIAEKQPYGFGRTLAALLEAGTLHDLSSVILQCANTLEQLLDCMPPPEELDVGMDGRLGLLLSALCLWAHGSLEDCKHTAKILVVKLGIRYSGDPQWDEAIAKTESVLLQAWNQGMDPTPEEEAAMEQEQEQRRRREEMMAKLGEDDEAGAIERDLAERGWLVPAGRVPRPCDADEACMYPQVFAILGYRGRGGPSVGVPPQSTFDRSGTFRRREVVKESRTVEFMKVLWNGSVQVWEETEETVKETTHLEAANGEFAHREKVKLTQREAVNGESTKEDKSRRDYVHLKNTTGEFATYVDCASPTSPQIAATSPDWSSFGFGTGGPQISSSTHVASLFDTASGPQQAEENHESTVTYVVHEPESPL
ncbi:Hypothetical Protein FCC1311_042182 [Hondaea fermentalgiana]|uniref:Uncharacterized protein n=1 Tax=Hondaea fermentalgiana TaxID=2315210 RepID=A0A2R5GBN4_9STRA|nr:Hypothetical Protein FCC1311_042182 [Hondaea fermentalgiana]|eukprot:GBG27995.1 Hypothetical Protein FCC1311_042182 [Hondaea fermentalgiana]